MSLSLGVAFLNELFRFVYYRAANHFVNSDEFKKESLKEIDGIEILSIESK